MKSILIVAVIFWVKSYNEKNKPPVFSVAQINIIPLGVGTRLWWVELKQN